MKLLHIDNENIHTVVANAGRSQSASIIIDTDNNFSQISCIEKDKDIGLDFEIDKLTNSIENVLTGDSFATEISILTTNDL